MNEIADTEKLTMMLLYLSRFTERNSFTDGKDCYAWKGYNFDALNKLEERDFIRQGSHPSKSKSVYITETGIKAAIEMLREYGITETGRSS